MPTRSTDRLVRLATPDQLRRWSLRCHAAGMSVGLVPTMGALHEGHLSLVRRARAECDRVVVSIFVNPTQFGPTEDYATYPRNLDADLIALEQLGVDAAFSPSAEAMYPPGGITSVHIQGTLGGSLEAVSRPGHLDGVALVVTKLFVAARPDRAYFGAKDAQQCAMVTRLAADLDTGVAVIECPTVRDSDGVALSSRNAYLDAGQRARAGAIPAGLAAAACRFGAGQRAALELLSPVRAALETAGLDIDYVALVEPDGFTDVEIAGPGCKILVAATIGSTRLIDTLRLGVDEAPLVCGAPQQECNGSS
ncbi:MAG: pantoate--beta-alanine ligase [Chloroflexi bacterium]|nr:MAG: pantoate--beta-alanine ligase [Chloroflexota bacterium]